MKKSTNKVIPLATSSDTLLTLSEDGPLYQWFIHIRGAQQELSIGEEYVKLSDAFIKAL